MAKIELIYDADEHRPPSVETIEVRPWDRGGDNRQPFHIGSGFNFSAATNIWLEIVYSVNGAQIFYTRNFLHYTPDFDIKKELKYLDQLVEKGEGNFRFGDVLPETELLLKVEKGSYQSRKDAEPTTYQTVTLTISVDTGAVFGFSSPGERFVEIRLDLDSVEEGVNFMRDLVNELGAVFQGKHPDPACFPPGACEWSFPLQLNRKAYNELAESYQEDYFANPLLAQLFDAWLAGLPVGGQVLDTGCGHGYPVIAKLLESGFQVTGADFSPEMLKRAREQFPQVHFVQQAATQLDYEAEFDGACSFSSLVYLDPIDFYHAVYRLYRALRPGGLLFLYGIDNGPDWRGDPLHFVLGHWMWGWHYGMEEAARRLAEHGYFKVLDAKRVWWDEEKEQKYAQDMKAIKEQEDENRRKKKKDMVDIMSIAPGWIERPPYGYGIIARRVE